MTFDNEPGTTVIAREVKTVEGYVLDGTPLEITNRQSGSALIHKIDSMTGKGIYGVKFRLSDAKGNPVGTYESDNKGYVYIDKELADGRYTICEIECADGYILDTQPKTVYMEYGGCTTMYRAVCSSRKLLCVLRCRFST